MAPTITLMAESHETRRRRRIEERLARLIGEGAAAFYHDALEILTADQLKSRGHLLGHLIRETDSALFQAMSPLVGLPPPREDPELAGKSSRRERAEQIAKTLRLPLDDPEVARWTANRFDAIAHRSRRAQRQRMRRTR